MSKHVRAALVFMALATQAVAQQPQKPNVVFILADTGTAIWAHTAAENCAARQRHVSTNWPEKECVLPSFWLSPLARRREQP